MTITRMTIMFRGSRHTLLAMLALAILATTTSSLATAAPPGDAAGPTTAPTSDALAAAKSSVWRLLSGHHHLPTTQQLLEATPLARHALVAILVDGELFTLHRRRALIVLTQAWPDEETLALLTTILTHEDERLLYEALGLLATHYPMEGAQRVASTLLDSPYATHRRAAIHTLDRLPVATQKALLERADVKETDGQNIALIQDRSRAFKP